jgi:hypothetical protein
MDVHEALSSRHAELAAGKWVEDSVASQGRQAMTLGGMPVLGWALFKTSAAH